MTAGFEWVGETDDVVDFCFKWNYADGCPGEPLTEAEARARHDDGTEFTAVLPGPVLVTPVWRSGVVAVTFLDGPGRKAAEYTFMKRAEEMLFLSRVLLWTYPDDRPGLRLADTTSHETITYREDGTASRVVKDKAAGTRETTGYTDVALEMNWEPVPAFGDYAAIGRFERGIQP